MPSLVQREHFAQTTGGLGLHARVAAAFLRQSGGWRDDFVLACERHDAAALKELLHKMKGSCHAVAAPVAASAFQQAENDVAHVTPSAWQKQSTALLAMIVSIEAELSVLIDEASKLPPRR
ncbi:MAG: Hpt domain-containing protein [Pseudomonadota bacterium]